MKSKETPLMRQYNQIKQKYEDTILLFRLGDFYETFQDDAVKTSQACGITLTKRNNGAAGDMPLAGFPHHQLDTYLPKLVKAGYRVAVCEQLEDPKLAKGIVKRGVTEVVTPGIALYDKLLEAKSNTFVATLYFKFEKGGSKRFGIALADASTGEFYCTELSQSNIKEFLEGIAPAEIILAKPQKKELAELIQSLSSEPAITSLEDWIFEHEFAKDTLLKHFETQNLKGFGVEELELAVTAAGATIYYIKDTQQSGISQIKNLSLYNTSDFMMLDYSTRKNLEILFSNSDIKNGGTLISILDKTCTPMGGRLLKKWISSPLNSLQAIQKRLDAVESLYLHNDKREFLRLHLNAISDLERLVTKVATGRANPRDIVNIKNSLDKIPIIKEILTGVNSIALASVSSQLDELRTICEDIENALLDEPSINLGSGNVFRRNYNQELDSYTEAKFQGKNWINEYQERERSATGINSLKVGFNNVFGYYIDITRIHSNKVPEHYQRKQTLTNSERYMTAELKDIEEKILNAEEKIGLIETTLFAELRAKVAIYTETIQKNAQLLASIDCLQSYAQVSVENNYVKPLINESTDLNIVKGRHPVVEKLLPIGETYTANNTTMNNTEELIHIITGPNMSGKSSYLRQTALIVLMGQIGCFVPAESAEFGLVDRIFTRVGAQDNITAGESTFLVEMQEAANIMNNATERSLILLDEVGRGTATFDGISIAWSIAEYIHNKICAKTLFATHYHELNDLATRYSKIVNYSVEVIEAGHTVIFSHNVVKGATDHSFGIFVAKMAGMPYDVITRAEEILEILENGNEDGSGAKAKPDMSKVKSKKQKHQTDQLAIFEFRDDELRERLSEIKIENITPIQALQLLSDLHIEAKKSK